MRWERRDDSPKRRAIALRPDFGVAHSNLAGALIEQNALEEALESGKRAVALAPDFAGALFYYATALLRLGRYAEAEPPLRRVLELSPGLAAAHFNLGMALKLQNRLGEASACLRRAVTINPEDDAAMTAWFNIRQEICDWSDYHDNESRARRAIARQPSLGGAFMLLAMDSTAAEKLACARKVASLFSAPGNALFPATEPPRGERIRVGYVSSQFRHNAGAYLIAGLLERHDRRRLEIFGYSYGVDDGSPMRARIAAAFDRFVDIASMSDSDAARLIQGDGIDILVDLDGFAGNVRTAIAACRPAPIQVNYLGYPGTMGADFIDYIIVDPFVAPSDQQPFFTERLVHLSGCYQCNDDRRAIVEQTPSRAECGLPETGFVFCCFNNSYKLTPGVFDVWMRLLLASPKSVLWLFDANPWAKANLATEARARGVNPERLVFAPPQPNAKHVARYRLADLFLDTLPYNAHTTASDALWAGLPVLTCLGDSFPGRVGGSLLRAVGLDELISTSLQEYEALALKISRESDLLLEFRTRLARNRATCSLFDTARFARKIEAAYRRMVEMRMAGQTPTAFTVEA
jgi:predicted O-linked N-acetylglucosamine transferase (SPINDLY family)